MFSLNKRFIASLLIFAMIFANAGMSTLAVSISHYVDRANQNAKDDSDISYRYYEEYRYSYDQMTRPHKTKQATVQKILPQTKMKLVSVKRLIAVILMLRIMRVKTKTMKSQKKMV